MEETNSEATTDDTSSTTPQEETAQSTEQNSESEQSEAQPDYPDTVNSLTMVGDFGFDHYGGPFEFVIQDEKWGVVIPKEPLPETRQTALKGHEDQPALVIADGEPVVGGHLTEVVEVEEHDELHAVGDSYPRGGN